MVGWFIWLLQPSTSITKDITVNSTEPSGGDYGPDVYYDDKRPTVVITLKAKGMTTTEKLAEEAKILTRGSTHNYTDIDGVTYTGRITAVACESKFGSWDTQYGTVWDVSITLRCTAAYGAGS